MRNWSAFLVFSLFIWLTPCFAEKIVGEYSLPSSPEIAHLLLEPQEGEHVLGCPNAPNIIIEYSSFTCPHCATSYLETFNEFKKRYIDTCKTKYIFRNIPTNINSMHASLAATCSTNYYEAVRMLFKTQRSWVHASKYADILLNIITLSNLRDSNFADCLKSQELQLSLGKQVVVSAKVLKIKATPTIFINGKLFEGKMNFMALDNLLNQNLKKVPTHKLIVEPNKKLHTPALTVPEVNDDIRALIDNMLLIMHKEHGVGLAAPQVGILKKIVVIEIPQKKESISCDGQLVAMPLFMVNPEIIESSSTTNVVIEGCLSFPGIHTKIERPSRVRVKYLDYYGNLQELKVANNLLTVCVQHETDHTNGIVFLDHLSQLKRDRLLKKAEKERIKRVREKAENI